MFAYVVLPWPLLSRRPVKIEVDEKRTDGHIRLQDERGLVQGVVLRDGHASGTSLFFIVRDRTTLMMPGFALDASVDQLADRKPGMEACAHLERNLRLLNDSDRRQRPT